ncbi:uncharacterized protein LOC114405274 [Glycine soja]|uniref:uncharacterized protein LOC114405274 n=1 Tax=Glycine soja TaxID=3848 RepID=UPI00071939F1|nr:uncharacterized protein LOC114405274 [Glycine soja]|eukprot:XP_014617939.1 uncharacterized protein LOC106794690 [Glycine max]
MSLAQPGDPPRVPPVQQYEEFVEADMYQQLMAVAAPNEADVDVHHVRHAIDDIVAIGDKLERLLNLRIKEQKHILLLKNVWASQEATLPNQL